MPPKSASKKASTVATTTATAAKLVTKARAPLKGSEVYIRLRPPVWDGSGHDQDGEGVAKSLDSWTETSVTLSTAYLFSDGQCEYSFPKTVLGPEVSQSDVFEKSKVSESVQSFVAGQNDTMFLAYGQTGTGKTTTIFGFEESIRGTHDTLQDGWGLFPRVAHHALELLREEGVSFKLGISAVEFYNGRCSDLVDQARRRVLISEKHTLQGHSLVPVETTSDIFPIVNTVINNRTSRGTNMNQAKEGEHSGSSRSHCALILTMVKVDDKGKMRRGSFTLMDLAGAERPSKTTEQKEKTEGVENLMRALYGPQHEDIPELSVEEQGKMINYELFELGKEVNLATNKHRRRLIYKAPQQNTTPFIQFMGSLLNGSCSTKMMICLSQAPQNGWETWFSLQYGKDLARLKAPVVTRKKWQAVDVAKKKARTTLESAEKACENLPPDGAPAGKFNYKKRVMLNDARNLEAFISSL